MTKFEREQLREQQVQQLAEEFIGRIERLFAETAEKMVELFNQTINLSD